MTNMFMNGKDFLIYIDETTAITAALGTEANYKLVASLKSNGFSGSINSIDTTTKDTEGWADSIPGDGSFEISGEGNAISIGAGVTDKVNFAKLSNLWLNKTSFWAKIANADDGIVREGVVYISSWSESFNNNESFTFSATFTGRGKPNLLVTAP